ncbi:unnamed protein product, partial [Musa textilis]
DLQTQRSEQSFRTELCRGDHRRHPEVVVALPTQLDRCSEITFLPQ